MSPPTSDRGPSDRELDRVLAELPRAVASPGFSRRVLGDLGDAAARRAGRAWLLAATAAAAALAAALWLWPHAAPPPAALAEAGALEQEHRLLMEELEALKASLRDREAAPVLYLGGTEGLDLILDLGPVWEDGAAGARPAAYRDAARPLAAAEQQGGDRR